MINPINKDFKTCLVEKIPSNRIIEQYQKDCKLDVNSYFKNIEFAEIHECEVTKYRFYYPFSIRGDADFYINLSKGKGNYYHERWEHKVAMKEAKSGEKWLEVGSGNSYFLEELSKIGVTALGLELNSEEVLSAKNENFEVLDCDFFSFDYKKGEYDTIALFQVLEHIQDISGFFEHAKALLKDTGKLIIGVPNNNPYLYVLDKFHTLNLPPHHMGLWSGESLMNVGEVFGLKVKELQFQPLSQNEFHYILNLATFGNISLINIKFHLLKFFRKILPKSLFNKISARFKNSLVNGRNIIVVFEKV